MLRRLIFSKFRAILGGKVRTLLSGGAPLAADTHDFIRTCLVTRLLQASTLITVTAQTDPNDNGDDDNDGEDDDAGLRADGVLLHRLHPRRGGPEHRQGGAAAPGHKEYQYYVH